MKTIIPGHRYELENVDKVDDLKTVQQLQFIQKEPIQTGSPILKTTINGTTCEEVLNVLIDRIEFLNQKISSRENSIAITKLEEALMWLRRRTDNRKRRGVEGTNNK